MNTLNYERPLNEKATSSSRTIADKSRTNTKRTMHTKAIALGYSDQTEYIEIDPFTGRIRTIRYSSSAPGF